jgi:RimJ/RimL family protein N-acetyltransferase
MGMIEIVNIEQSGVQLGYVLARQFWGNGYMTEALKTIIDWAFDQNDIYRVWAVCDIENTASARVMVKAGLEKEGILRRWVILPNFGEKPRDCFCFSIVR